MVDKDNGQTATAEPSQVEDHRHVKVPPLALQTMEVEIAGVTPMIQNRWSEKAEAQIKGKQAKEAKTAKPVREPEEEFQAASYRMPNDRDVYAVPARSFKQAMVQAARYVDGIPMTFVRGAFQVEGELIPMTCSEPWMRQDFVRLKGAGSADIRYRPQFDTWSCTLRIVYNADVVTEEQIVNLLVRAGFHCGIGEMRPQRSGDGFGRFTVSGAPSDPDS